jgi:hypothetical protein
MTQRLSFPRETGRPVGQVAEVLLLADREAEIREGTKAVGALAALRREQRHDMIALSHERDSLAAALHDTGALMA